MDQNGLYHPSQKAWLCQKEQKYSHPVHFPLSHIRRHRDPEVEMFFAEKIGTFVPASGKFGSEYDSKIHSIGYFG